MATLVRREPFGIDIPELFNRFFEERFFPERLIDLTYPSRLLEAGSMFRVEEFRENGTLVVRAELPGIDPDKDVEVSVHEGLLHIKAERTEREENAEKAFYRSEFHYGMLERMLPLPVGATEKDVKATYKDGVLEIRVPMKAEAVKAAKVPVKRLG